MGKECKNTQKFFLSFFPVGNTVSRSEHNDINI